jgi:tetratricopeptide (TPR) repeat protein
MAKKQNNKRPEEIQQATTPEVEVNLEKPVPPVPKITLSIYDFKVQAIIVALLAFIFYINTASNEFAHDDGIVIVKNEYVQEGFAGLKGIFTEDAYASYYRQLNTVNQLSGGRYRPLSIATFAIEQQFFGAVPVEKIDSFLQRNISYGIRGKDEMKLVRDMHVRHVFNVLWYMACVVVLLYFLRYIVLRNQPMVAFIAAVLFTIHPIHTEVVANVKSRDEIMSLLFMCLTFILAFKYEEQKKPALLASALVSFFLAFLSKEYAITLVALLPLSFFLFEDYSIWKSIKRSIPYFVVVGIYIFIRIKMAIHVAGLDTADNLSLPEIFETIKATGVNAEKEVLNNPYYFADKTQKLATEIGTSINYLKLLFWPHPLSADYSYNSIPYKTFAHPQVWLSIIVHLAMLAGIGVYSFVKKQYKFIGFALAFYMFHLLLVNNIIFNIGATMGERLIFHSSVGFSIIIAWLLVTGAEKIKPAATSQTVLGGVMLVITVLCGIKTVTRNKDWTNDKSLFFQDIKTVPNSVLVNGNVAAALITMSDQEKNDTIRRKYIHEAIGHLDRAISVHHTFVAGFLNKGIGYYKLGEMDSAKMCLDSVRLNYPNYPTLKTLYSLLGDYHMKKGWNDYGQFGKYPEAIREFQAGIAIDSTNAELWYNLGGAYFSNKQYNEAVNAWQHTLQLNPGHKQAMNGMGAAVNILKGQNAPPPPRKK